MKRGGKRDCICISYMMFEAYDPSLMSLGTEAPTSVCNLADELARLLTKNFKFPVVFIGSTACMGVAPFQYTMWVER